MLVNKILKLKNNRYKLFIDDEVIITYDNVILENNLLFKKNIDKKEYNKILQDTEFYKVYNLILNSVLKKRKTESEVRKLFNSYNLSKNQRESIIKKLKNIGLINDNEYCKAYIDDQIYLLKKGVIQIKKGLVAKGISEEIIDDNLKNIDNKIIKNNLEKTIIKKVKLNTKYSKNYVKKKIISEMINKGYKKEDILDVLEKIEFNDKDILEKEYKKTYMSLSKKYSGFELNTRLKQRLISKGFDLDDISKLL